MNCAVVLLATKAGEVSKNAAKERGCRSLAPLRGPNDSRSLGNTSDPRFRISSLTTFEACTTELGTDGMSEEVEDMSSTSAAGCTPAWLSVCWTLSP